MANHFGLPWDWEYIWEIYNPFQFRRFKKISSFGVFFKLFWSSSVWLHVLWIIRKTHFSFISCTCCVCRLANRHGPDRGHYAYAKRLPPQVWKNINKTHLKGPNESQNCPKWCVILRYFFSSVWFLCRALLTTIYSFWMNSHTTRWAQAPSCFTRGS